MIKVCILYKSHRWAENVYEQMKKVVTTGNFGYYRFRYNNRWEIIIPNARISFVRYQEDKIKGHRWDYVFYESLTMDEYDEVACRCRALMEY